MLHLLPKRDLWSVRNRYIIDLKIFFIYCFKAGKLSKIIKCEEKLTMGYFSHSVYRE